MLTFSGVEYLGVLRPGLVGWLAAVVKRARRRRCRDVEDRVSHSSPVGLMLRLASQHYIKFGSSRNPAVLGNDRYPSFRGRSQPGTVIRISADTSSPPTGTSILSSSIDNVSIRTVGLDSADYPSRLSHPHPSASPRCQNKRLLRKSFRRLIPRTSTTAMLFSIGAISRQAYIFLLD